MVLLCSASLLSGSAVLFLSEQISM
jgi:hypothetical protein